MNGKTSQIWDSSEPLASALSPEELKDCVGQNSVFMYIVEVRRVVLCKGGELRRLGPCRNYLLARKPERPMKKSEGDRTQAGYLFSLPLALRSYTSDPELFLVHS